MAGLDRYFSFGIRKNWMEIFFQYEGSIDFWDKDGGGFVPNKKKDAFLNFVRDAGLVVYNKSIKGDKFAKNEPSALARALFERGVNSEFTWAVLLCNLVYTPAFKWFIKNITPFKTYTPDTMKYLLDEVMETDAKGLGKRNIVDAFKILLIKTPFGAELGLGHCDYTEKVNTGGNETISLNSFYRDAWKNPEPLVILYSLYKFAEACGGYHQFTLTRLLDHEIDSDGISPSEIFSLDRSTMEKILNSLSVNYPDFVTTQFNLDLDTITLNIEKTSDDIISLF